MSLVLLGILNSQSSAAPTYFDTFEAPVASGQTFLAKNGNTYLAASTGTTTYYTSTNFTSWTQRTLPSTTGPYKGLVAAGGYFYFHANDASEGYYSTDGVNWTNYYQAHSGSWLSTDGTYIFEARAASGGSSTLYYRLATNPTANNSVWSTFSPGSGDYNGEVIRSNGYYYLPEYGDSRVYYSTAVGNSVTARTSMYNATYEMVRYGKVYYWDVTSRWYLTGAYAAQYITTYNGSWSNTSEGWESDYRVIADDTYLFKKGTNADGNSSAIYGSTDAATWTEIQSFDSQPYIDTVTELSNEILLSCSGGIYLRKTW